MEKIKKIKKLIQQLNQYRDSYYNNSISEVSDYEYDKLFDELKQLEEETNIVMANSPIHTVGYEVKSELKKVKHSHPMLSLDKTKSVDELKKFAGDQDCLLTCKMDGLTVLLSYNNGQLAQAETRGNGEEGEIIVHNAKVFENIPLHIDYPGYLEVEGEAIITYEDFDKINSNLSEDCKYKNPRNLANGSVRQLDSSIAAKRHIKFIAWKVPKIEDEIKNNNSFLHRLLFVKQLGFDVVPFLTYSNNTSDREDCEVMIEDLRKYATNKDFPIDGLVMTYNDIIYGESLGTTGHHPRHSLAFKFYDDIYPTKLLDVDFTMGKTGCLTPTAIFEPVEIDGTIVERASLHNLSIMNDLGITHRGQIVNVYKANAIIPQIDSVEKDNIKITKDNRIVTAEKCPICGAGTKIIQDNNTKVLICTNPDCKGKLLRKLSHFVSKNAINIDGLSEQTLQKFIDLGWLSSFIDIYYLSEHKEEMYKLDGFGKKSVDKLLENIDKSRNTTLDRFIYGLCIHLIGRSASKDIAKYCNNDIDKFIKIMIENKSNDFVKYIDGFGNIMYESLNNWWNEHCLLFLEISKEFCFKTVSENSSNKDLSGKIFVITGSLNHYKNRDELVNLITSMNGKVLGSVSSKTSYLLNNDINSTSSKNRKAKKLNIPIITEEDFIKMIS